MGDYIVRATAAGGQVRAFAATTKGLVEEAKERHNMSPIATVALGRLLTGGAMMGTMMKIMPILNTFKEDDETTCLLKALRPFLSEEKRKKLDEGIRLMRIMRLLPLLKGTDMFEMFR